MSVLFGLILMVAGPHPADVLRVERQEDRAGRNAMVARLDAVTVDFHAEAMPVRDAARWLALAAGDGVNLVYTAADDPAGERTLTLDVRGVRMSQLLRLIDQVSDLACVYRSGVVLLKPDAEVREETLLRIYDVRAAVAPLVDFAGPRLEGLRPSGYEPEQTEPAESTRGTVCGFTLEDIERVLRENVPTGFESEGTHLATAGGLLIVRHTERGHAQVRSILRALGVAAS